MIDFTFQLEGGGTPPQILVADGSRPPFSWPGNQTLRLRPQQGRAMFFGAPEGYWDRVVDPRQLNGNSAVILFPRIRANGALPWWHQFHGLTTQIPRIREPLRVGVIDEALAPQSAASCIAHVINLGGEAWDRRTTARALTPLTLHGLAVCSLLGSRVRSGAGFPGIASDAELYFAAAGRDTDEKIDISRLNACIDHLVDTYQCHIISVSAGDFQVPLKTVEQTVTAAADSGTLCFFAAGNLGRPLYPASQPYCLAVAAIGRAGLAPAGTNIEHVDLSQCDPLAAPAYLWRGSARGPEIEFCATGVGVIWNRNGAPAKASVGTSYACPIAAGLAARLLAEDVKFRQTGRTRQRYDRALEVLAAACRPFGGPCEGAYWKYGCPVIP